MLIKIRNRVFETNSSSVHTLTIGSQPRRDKIIDKNFEIVVGNGEYGWGYETLIDWDEKADYLGVEAREDKGARHLLESAIKKRYPNISIEYSDYGYIDHQSYGEIWSELNNVNEVYDFLFGNSTVIISNDNI